VAGLYSRIAERDNPSFDAISAHLTKALLYLVVRGVLTGAQAKTALEGKLRVPLTTAETTDFSNIVTQANAQATTILKVDYLERLDALNICVESGVLTNEGTWRSQLGIT
jgi:hypothetical protein